MVATEGALLSGKRPTSLAGAPPKNARVFLDRVRPILAARWVRSARRAAAYLNDPGNPIDALWVKIFDSLGDRVGLLRGTLQTVDATSVTATVSYDSIIERIEAAQRMRVVEFEHAPALDTMIEPGPSVAVHPAADDEISPEVAVPVSHFETRRAPTRGKPDTDHEERPRWRAPGE
jgi:hypothetical protein